MRARDGTSRSRARIAAVVLLASACAGLALALPGGAAAEQTAAEKCAGENFFYTLYSYGVRSTLTPAEGTEAQVHSSVTFSGESAFGEPEPGKRVELPLSFQVGTSVERNAEGEEVVAHPYLASGSGTASPGGSPETRRYSFTTGKATGNPGTVYWQASFTTNLASCNNGKGETKTYTTSSVGKPLTLAVVSPTETPAPIPTGPGNESSSSPNSEGLKIGITSAPVVHIGHPAVAYLVDCTIQCTGQTSFQAWQLRGRHKPVRVKALDFGPRSISIGGSSGGNERFTAHFRARALKKLRSMLRGGGEVKLVVTAKAKGPKGSTVQTQRVILLKR